MQYPREFSGLKWSEGPQIAGLKPHHLLQPLTHDLSAPLWFMLWPQSLKCQTLSSHWYIYLKHWVVTISVFYMFYITYHFIFILQHWVWRIQSGYLTLKKYMIVSCWRREILHWIVKFSKCKFILLLWNIPVSSELNIYFLFQVSCRA